MTKITDIRQLSSYHMPIGSDMAREFTQSIINMYEAAVMLYYTGSLLSAEQNLSVFDYRELSGIPSYDKIEANWLCSFKTLSLSGSKLFGADLAVPMGIGSSQTQNAWKFRPLTGQSIFPFDKMFKAYTLDQFIGAWGNFMTQVVSPAYKSREWKIYSCPWIISSALDAGNSGGATMLWDSMPEIMPIANYPGMLYYANNGLGLKVGGAFGNIVNGNLQTLATMSANLLFPAGDHRVLTASCERGSDFFLSDIVGAYQFFDQYDEYAQLPISTLARQYDVSELATGNREYLRLGSRMYFPSADNQQYRSLSIPDAWISAPGVWDTQDLRIGSDPDANLQKIFPSIHTSYRQFRALADFYYTHMQSGGDICRFASSPFDYHTKHVEEKDSCTLTYSSLISVNNEMTKVLKKVTSHVVNTHTKNSAAEMEDKNNTVLIKRRQGIVNQQTGDGLTLHGNITLHNYFYNPDIGGQGITKVEGLPAGEAALADSLFPPSIWQQKMDDIDDVRQLSAQQLLSVQQQLSQLTRDLSDYNDIYVDLTKQGWLAADAPYDYLNGFVWADYTTWDTIDEACWDYVWNGIENDPALPGEEDKNDRMIDIEDSWNDWMGNNGGFDAFNDVADCIRNIRQAEYLIKHIPYRAQLSVDQISASQDYHVDVPDISWLTAYMTKDWQIGGAVSGTGYGEYGASITCIYPAISSNWSRLNDATDIYYANGVWPLPQLVYGKQQRNAPIQIEDCVPTKISAYNSTSELSGVNFVYGRNSIFNSLRYLSADETYMNFAGEAIQIFASNAGFVTPERLSGTAPDLNSYVYNDQYEEDLSSYMPYYRISASALLTPNTCIYEGRQAQVLEIVLTPAQTAGKTNYTFANGTDVVAASWDANLNIGLPSTPPLSILNYYDSNSEFDTIWLNTFGTRYRSARMQLEPFALTPS